ncbi:zinc finger protein 37 homolog [Branchiostoma floridae]|uniref:Zinc finger protein 37 homolog n=1 Tax=Branchiostoma floridae TaxID=7739 RepID=A0A9J7KGS9_BRAFL|nr:zinc finger protein 37 homolog [Branchiostoma floridae]
MPGQQAFICGLSHEVTIAVLPRLNTEELMFELNRRIKDLDTDNSIKDRLVSILKDLMLEEYRQLKKSQVSSADDMTMKTEDEAARARHNNELNNIASTQGLDTTNSMDASRSDKPPEGDQPCDEAPLASRQPTLDNGDIHKRESPMPEQNQIGQVSIPPNPDHAKSCTDDRDTGSINSGHDQGHMQSNQPIDYPIYDISTDFKPYACKVCGLRTMYRQNLAAHMRRHKGRKPFLCGECGYRAYHKFRLVEHMRTHTGEKPFKCDQCDYKTAYKVDLVAHLKKHAGEEPYRCKICDYTTYRKPDIKKHTMRCHAGVKPHKNKNKKKKK